MTRAEELLRAMVNDLTLREGWKPNKVRDVVEDQLRIRRENPYRPYGTRED